VVRPNSDPVKPRRRKAQHHSPREHAIELVKFIQRNGLHRHGMIFAAGMKEFYTEAVIELGWAPRPWNPIARQIDLICTNGQKPYAWTMDDYGRMRRRRYYPVPDTLSDVSPSSATSAQRVVA
jgi:hypothetical protein